VDGVLAGARQIMSTFLDTSVVVRYLTDAPPDMAARAAAVIDSERHLLLSLLVLAETAYVLGSVYGVPRAEVVDGLVALVLRRNITVPEVPKETAVEALLLCRASGKVSYSDALLWSLARSSDAPSVLTFDADFPCHGLEVSAPA